MLTIGTPSSTGSTARSIDALPLSHSYMRHGDFLVNLYGRFIEVPPGEQLVPGDHVMVRVHICVRPLRSPYYSLPPSLELHACSFELPFDQRSQLHSTIRQALVRGGQSVVGDDHELTTFLAERFTSMVCLWMQGTSFARDRLAPPGTFEIVCGIVRLLPLIDHPSGGEATAAEPATTTSSSLSTTSLSAGVGALLRKVTYRKKRNEGEEEERAAVAETACPICLKDFEDDEEVHLTPCQHPFHLSCLQRWLHLNAVCPLCRSAMPLR